ncbi:MAG: 3-phosphoshikimate 1-carboxyvinyltransferase [Myxococcales bacterium]|nr:3-phosphoshikimate 1-carboxyvinyltransferase [Myxococcales bacterium]
MTDLLVHPQAAPLKGRVPLPSDKSIAHRALMIASLGASTSRFQIASVGEDNRATGEILRALGVDIDEQTGPGGQSQVTVKGRGLFGFVPPKAPLDCKNSGTSMRLLAGLLAGQAFSSTLVGDESLSRRPMRRILAPLSARGARIEGRRADPKGERDSVTAPLVIAGVDEGSYLAGLEWESPIASAQVKSAILLSGLMAHGITTLSEPSVSRDHTERMLAATGAPLRTAAGVLCLDPSGWDGRLSPVLGTIPGDLSAAAFLLSAATLVPGSTVVVRDVGLNPTRTGFLEIARDMGAGLTIEHHGEVMTEPVGDVEARYAPLSRIAVGGELLVRAIDEVPIVLVLAARAAGVTRIGDAGELRVKESDRLAAMGQALRAFGVRAEERLDGIEVEGREGPLSAADVDAAGDHRIAMASCVLALLADGPSRIRGVDNIRTSFPRFVGTMRALGARIDVA